MKEKTMINKMYFFKLKHILQKQINNLIILFTMNIKRTDDYALIRKIETLKKNKIHKKSRIQIE